MTQRNLVSFGLIIIAISSIYITDHFASGKPYFTLAPLFAIVVMSAYHGGLFTSILVGLMVGGYGFYASPDFIRALIIFASIALIVIPVAILKRSVDNKDIMMSRLRDLDILLSGIEARWLNLSEAEKRGAVGQARHKVSNMLTLSMGWIELAKERSKVLKEEPRK